MTVETKNQKIYHIDDSRGEKLKSLIRSGSELPFKINLDGRGLMVDPRLITVVGGEEVHPPEPVVEPTPSEPTTVTDAWKVAIRRNLEEIKTKGKYGVWTAQQILHEYQTLQGSEG